MCLPKARWFHRCLNPTPRTYPRGKDSRTRNYLIGFDELIDNAGDKTLPSFLSLSKVCDQFGISPPAAARISGIDVKKLEPIRAKVFVAERPQTIAVVGDPRYGPVKMRAACLTDYGNAESFTSQAAFSQRFDVILAVKGDFKGEELRKKTDRLIYDPCDDFWAVHDKFRNPADYWRRRHKELKFDEIIATSPACERSMREALPSMPIHLIPHHCDDNILNYSDTEPTQPPFIAYAGQPCFIKSKLKIIEAACQAIGMEFRTSISPKVLIGATVGLALRCPPYDTPLNGQCKPQVKIENLAALRLRSLVTAESATLSLRPKVTSIGTKFELDELVLKILFAASQPRLNRPYTKNDFLNDILVVIYGGEYESSIYSDLR